MQRKSWSRRASAAAKVVSIAAVAAAGSSCNDAVGPETSREIVLGGVFSLTGNWSTLGLASKAAMELAVEDVNRFIGGHNFHFSADVHDSRLIPETALAKVQELRANGVEVVIGPQSSAEVAAIKPYADANGVLVLSQSSTAGSLALANDNVFRFTPSDTLEGVAISALMVAEGIRAIVPMWRADAAGTGLRDATRAEFIRSGGSVSAGVEYAATGASYSAAVAALATQVSAAVAQHGAGQVAVYLAAFDEVVDIFNAASQNPALSSVRWYGSGGVALSAALPGNVAAAQFASQVNYPNPIFGLDNTASDSWSPIAQRIKARSGQEAEAFSLAVYDAVWVAAEAYLATVERVSIEVLRQKLVTAANSHFGATGWTALNAAGDRRFGNFDYWAIRSIGGANQWVRVARYDSQSGQLTTGLLCTVAQPDC